MADGMNHSGLRGFEKKLIEREKQKQKELNDEPLSKKLDKVIDLLTKILYAIQGLAIFSDEKEEETLGDLLDFAEDKEQVSPIRYDDA